jgi:hypothetical protein
MLDVLEYTEQPVEAQRVVTGQWLGKARFDARQRAKLAALWVSRRLEVKPTVKAAVTIFGVSQVYISEALADLKTPARKGKAKKNGTPPKAAAAKMNGNGHDDRAVVIHDFIPDINDLWSHMTDDEREDFVHGHASSIWSMFDHITA